MGMSPEGLPHDPTDNRTLLALAENAELEIGQLKRHYHSIMHQTRCPKELWGFGMLYTAAGLRLQMSREGLNDRTLQNSRIEDNKVH
jgi:hypothetical protein